MIFNTAFWEGMIFTVASIALMHTGLVLITGIKDSIISKILGTVTNVVAIISFIFYLISLA